MEVDFKDYLSYDPMTGKLYWKYREDCKQNWNKRFCGKEAGNKMPAGYVQVQVKNKNYRAHRFTSCIASLSASSACFS